MPISGGAQPVSMLINPSSYVPFTATLSLSKEEGVEWAARERVTAAFLFYRQWRDAKRSRRGWGLGTASKEQGAGASWGLQAEGRESHVSHGQGS